MLRAGIDVKVAHESVGKDVLREHAFHDFSHEAVRAFFHEAFGCDGALAAGIAGVSEIDTVSPFFACEPYLVGVYDDDIVAAVNVGGEVRFVFTPQELGNLRGHAAQYHIRSIYHDPFFFYGRLVGRDGFVA